MIHMVPGDPATIMLGPRATPELREALRLRLGLDEPFVVQVGSFFLSVLTGDLGIGIVRDQPVADIVLRQLPYTVALVLSAIGWETEEHTSELQSLMRISYAVFCLKQKIQTLE